MTIPSRCAYMYLCKYMNKILLINTKLKTSKSFFPNCFVIYKVQKSTTTLQIWIWSCMNKTSVSTFLQICRHQTMHRFFEIFEKLPRAVFCAYTTPFDCRAPWARSWVKFSVVWNTWNVVWFYHWKIKTQYQTKTFVSHCKLMKCG